MCVQNGVPISRIGLLDIAIKKRIEYIDGIAFITWFTCLKARSMPIQIVFFNCWFIADSTKYRRYLDLPSLMVGEML